MDSLSSSPERDAGVFPMLELVDVSLGFRARQENFAAGVHDVLRDVSFQLHEGEVLGVMGRNGVGKTTLLRLMAGIIAPGSGQVRRRAGATCALLSLGLGFQAHLSGRDNARLAVMLQGGSARDAEASLAAIQEFSELGASFDEPVKTYSAGMRARLGFATTLKTQVDILLIDEILAVGDASFRQKARQAMVERISSSQTVVLVSHAEAAVRELCSRLIVLDEGRLVHDGDVDGGINAYFRRQRVPG